MSATEASGHPHNPLIRVYTFGEFTLERLVSSEASTEGSPCYEPVARTEWRGRGTALILLKALLCHKGRRGFRDELIDAIWSETQQDEMKQVERAFDSAASVLRSVLRLPDGESLLETIPGGLLLPGQQQVWVDADHFESLIQQGLWADAPQESTMLLQEAHRLIRGEFLEDDLYQDWATARREMLYGKMGECVYALTDLYTKQQRPDLARAVLWEFLMMFPTDMDALYRLMALLEQQGREHAAWRLYKQAKETAAQDGFSLPPRIHTLAKRIKERLASSEMNPTVPAATPVPLPATAKVLPETLIPALVQADGANNGFPLVSQAIAQGIIQAVRELGDQDMDKFRRLLLQQALGVTGAAMITPLDELLKADVLDRLAKALKKPSNVDKTMLTNLEAVTREKRQRFVLSEGTHWFDLFCETSGHLSLLTRLLEQTQPTTIYTLLCTQVSETTLLIGDMFFNARQNEASERYYALALETAKEAHHDVLQAVILGRMAFLPIYSGTPNQALPLIEQAQSLVSQNTADIIPAWLWAITGEAYANMGNADACSEALAQAESLLNRGRPGNVSMCFEEDTARAIFSPFYLLSYKGICSIRLKEPEAAQESLCASLNQADSRHLQHRSIALADLGMTYVQQTDIREACQYASQTLSLVGQTGSGRVLQRVLRLRHELDPWKNTLYVKQLDEHMASVIQSETFRGNA